MSRKKTTQPEETTSTDDWIVTFSDCMTLLLCFFVMLMSFSTFDEQEIADLSLAFNYITHAAVSDIKKPIPESIIKKPDVAPLKSDIGSVTPTVDENQLVRNPKQRKLILSVEAFRDRRVFQMPSSRLFCAKGLDLTTEGKQRLKLMGEYLHLLPCRVVVSESSPNRSNANLGKAGLGLKRAMAIVRFFTDTKPNGMGLAASLFSISDCASGSGQSGQDREKVKISLMTRSKYK